MSLELNGFGVDRPRGTCAAHRPISARLEPASRLRSVQHWFACAAPSDLARRAPRRPNRVSLTTSRYTGRLVAHRSRAKKAEAALRSRWPPSDLAPRARDP